MYLFQYCYILHMNKIIGTIYTFEIVCGVVLGFGPNIFRRKLSVRIELASESIGPWFKSQTTSKYVVIFYISELKIIEMHFLSNLLLFYV